MAEVVPFIQINTKQLISNEEVHKILGSVHIMTFIWG